jgi:hypothetical protein
MTLKEKLFNVIFDNLWDHKESVIVPEIEKITDDFAIGFGKWILRNFNNYGPNDEKELLEIYKKENGL